MCKYCEDFLGSFEESCAESNFGENAVIRKRFGCFYLESIDDDFNLMIDYCPWCGQELDAEPKSVEEDDNPYLLALGCMHKKPLQAKQIMLLVRILAQKVLKMT